MKFLHVMALGLMTSSLAIVGCSNGMMSYYSGGGTQCAKDYDPIPTDMSKTPGFTKVADCDNKSDCDNKIVFSKNNAGTYVFQGSDAYFKDSNKVRIHVNIRPDNKQVSVVNRTCVDGIAQFDRQRTKGFTDYLPGVRELTTDFTGKPTSFKIENIGYIMNGDPQIKPAIAAVNCDLSEKPLLPPVDKADKNKPDPTLCGTLDASSIKKMDGKPASVRTLSELFPRPGADDKLTIWCQDITPGSCADPLAAKTYHIRYSINHRTGHTPTDGITRTINYSAAFTWTPTPTPAAVF